MPNKNSFWKNRKVLVTGFGGFVGTALAKKLVKLKAQVVGVSRNRIKHNPPKGIKLIACDLANLSQVKSLINKTASKTVFHFAGFAIVSEAFKNPIKTLNDNFLSTLNLLESMRHSDCREFILGSSDKVYGHHAKGEAEPLPYKEFYGLRGLDIYSSSKVCADIITRAFTYQYGIKSAVARSCNIYGPGDVNFSRLIPKTAMLLLNKKPPQIKAGHANILREYIYIDDAVDAYILLAEKLSGYYGDNLENAPKQGLGTVGWPVFNIGSGISKFKYNKNVKSVEQVVEVLQKLISRYKPVVMKESPKFIEIPDEYQDSSKLASLGYKQKVGFETGIKKTVEWYKKNFKYLNKNFYI